MLAVTVVRWPTRPVILAIVTLSAASIGAWVVSRTAGLPFGANAGHAESVTIVDGITVGMEGAAIVLAVALLSRDVLRVPSGRLASAAVVAVLALTSTAIASPDARDHAAAAHGVEDHGTTGSSDEAAAASDAVAGPTDLNGHHIKGVKAQDVAAETEPDEPLDPATRELLRQQLVIARDTALRYPTAADAEAAGYRLVAGFGPGAGAHYIGGPMTGPGLFDPTKAQSLLYDGTSPTSQIVGLMYFGMGDEAPEGFAGPNDHWHRHSSVCTKSVNGILDVPFPPDSDVTRAQCDSVGGNFMEITGWMVHAWVVPSWESPAGVFSHENPNLRCADGTFNTDKVGKCEGT
jgi:hypothetical protein